MISKIIEFIKKLFPQKYILIDEAVKELYEVEAPENITLCYSRHIEDKIIKEYYLFNRGLENNLYGRYPLPVDSGNFGEFRKICVGHLPCFTDATVPSNIRNCFHPTHSWDGSDIVVRERDGTRIVIHQVSIKKSFFKKVIHEINHEINEEFKKSEEPKELFIRLTEGKLKDNELERKWFIKARRKYLRKYKRTRARVLKRLARYIKEVSRNWPRLPRFNNAYEYATYDMFPCPQCKKNFLKDIRGNKKWKK